jgi:uncharacterized protein (TIGR02246 family)
MVMRMLPICLLAIVMLAGCQPHAVDPGQVNEVEGVFNEWIADVNRKDMQKLLALYDERADLHPTLSGTLRVSSNDIEAYFRHFLALPNLHVEASNPHIQVFGAVAINDGFYQFAFVKNGGLTVLKARYSFTYLKEPDGWRIIDHHSSIVPGETQHSDIPSS